jgi:hypothetical protein
MSDAWPDGGKKATGPESDARSPVVPPLRSTIPAFDDPSVERLHSAESLERNAIEEGARKALLEFVSRGHMRGTAERLGNAVGSAQRQMRRGLELVRRPTANPAAAAEQFTQEASDRAARLMEDIEEEVNEMRRQAALKLDKMSDQAGEQFQQLRLRARTALARSRERAEQIADRYPLQTIAAAAGVCFVFGVALRLRRSHRG